MRIRPHGRKMFLCAVCACGLAVSTGLPAQVMRYDPGAPISVQEETARFLPGLYYFQKGLDYYKKGQAPAAVEAWQVAAGWAMKDAQYNLGLAYFKGSGVTEDRPRGLAWLALAAERKDATFQGSLATAWESASDAEHQQANAIWRELKKQYGDETALPRARKRFDVEVGQLSGSHVGSGSAKVVSRTMGQMDASTYREKLEELAEQNFGKSSASAAGAPESTDADRGKDAG
jgi:TPR repeat protein